MPLAIMECKKPVIAAVNGPAIGAGVAMVACCDILLAAETAYLALNEINVGLLGGSRHAMRLFGHSKIRRMMFTGYKVYGPEMLQLGVVELRLNHGTPAAGASVIPTHRSAPRRLAGATSPLRSP